MAGLSPSLQFANAVPPGFDNNERPMQFPFSVEQQQPLKFRVDRVNARWRHPEIEDAASETLNMNKPTEIVTNIRPSTCAPRSSSRSLAWAEPSRVAVTTSCPRPRR